MIILLPQRELSKPPQDLAVPLHRGLGAKFLRWSRTLVVSATVLAVAIASPAIAENLFKESDSDAFVQLNRAALALSKDISNSGHILGQGREFDQAQCLSALHDALDSTENLIFSATDLIYLSARMRDPMDEAIVNATLASNASLAVRALAENRQYALGQGAICSTSAVVNTNAEKVAAITDRATALFNGIGHRMGR